MELLKLDVQGMEGTCLSGASDALEHVDNIFLEIQDLRRGRRKFHTRMQSACLDIGEMDNKLSKFGFVRQL